MIEKLPFFAEDVCTMVISVEHSISDLNRLKPGTRTEGQLRQKLIDLLQTSEASLIDANALLLDAAMCHDDFDLALLISQVESEPVP